MNIWKSILISLVVIGSEATIQNKYLNAYGAQVDAATAKAIEDLEKVGYTGNIPEGNSWGDHFCDLQGRPLAGTRPPRSGDMYDYRVMVKDIEGAKSAMRGLINV